jgi:hypothetical protein
MMCLFEHKNIKYYTDADLRSLRINERSPQCQESNDAAYVRSLRIKDKVSIFAEEIKKRHRRGSAQPAHQIELPSQQKSSGEAPTSSKMTPQGPSNMTKIT